MPIYPAGYYDEFVARAQAAGSGLGVSMRQDGSLNKLGKLLRADSTPILIQAEIAALGRARDAAHVSKLRKYRDAIAFLENTFPIAPGLRQAPGPSGVEAVLYLRNATRPSANFPGGNLDYGSLTRVSSVRRRLGISVAEFMADNALTTRVLLIHLGESQTDMTLAWDGLTALEHMNAVLATALDNQIPVGVLRDPHTGTRGVNVPSPGNAVCPGLRAAMGAIPATHAKVFDGGDQHSAFHDPAFQTWAAAAQTVVVMGFDADVCVRGNVFGVTEREQGSDPPALVPALLNVADVLTARPLLSGGATPSIQAYESWGGLSFLKQD